MEQSAAGMEDRNRQHEKVSGWGSRLRVFFFIVCVLLVFYAGVNFRIIVIPDYYLVLHPFVLPGQHWVYRYSTSFGNTLEAGDKVLFRFRDEDGRIRRHISHIAGMPGHTVEYMPGQKAFRINSSRMLTGDFHFSGAWEHAPYEKITLGPDEYLLFDNNVRSGNERFWKVDRDHIIGKFLFQLPF
jgi:hypothetical protein